MSKKILIAEDELLIAKVLRLQLEKLNFIVENVVDARQVLEKTIEMQPDFIILDVFLKNKSTGLDAAKIIRERGINTPIIITTGNSYESTLELSKNISHSKVLSKPVVFEQLLKMLEEF